MKKTTRDITRGRDRTILIGSESCILQEPFLEKLAVCHLSPEKKMLDLPPAPSGITKKTRFRKRFFLVLGSAVFIFIGGVGVSAMSLKENMTQMATIAHEKADNGIHQLINEQYLSSIDSFTESARLFGEMRASLQPFVLNARFTEASIRNTDEILSLASTLTETGTTLATLAPALKTIPGMVTEGNGNETLAVLQSAATEINTLQTLSSELEEKLNTLGDSLIAVPLKENIESAKAILPVGKEAIATAGILIAAVQALVGAHEPHTTAIYFQNSGEIRATGGFPGSMMLLSAEQGKVVPEFQDIYYYSWKNTAALPPPPGFERLADRLTPQDANYFFDFPDSAVAMRKMLEFSTGPKAETVVVITDRLLEEILYETGPIPIPNTAQALSAENLKFVLPYLVEAKISGKHTPKEVINQLVPELKKEVQALPAETLKAIARRAINEKWILAHSTDARVTEAISRLNIGGAIQNPQTADYLAVVSANVGGNKSDNFLEESHHLASAITLDRQITNTLTITRTHTWDAKADAVFEELAQKFGSPFVPLPLLREIVGAGENHAFTQVFVPEGAELLEVRGLPPEVITTSMVSGKTVFSFRFPKVATGSVESVSLRYLMPKPLAEDGIFDLYFQTQPGRDGVSVTREVVPEVGLFVDHELASRKLFEDARFTAIVSNENPRD